MVSQSPDTDWLARAAAVNSSADALITAGGEVVSYGLLNEMPTDIPESA